MVTTVGVVENITDIGSDTATPPRVYFPSLDKNKAAIEAGENIYHTIMMICFGYGFGGGMLSIVIFSIVIVFILKRRRGSKAKKTGSD